MWSYQWTLEKTVFSEMSWNEVTGIEKPIWNGIKACSSLLFNEPEPSKPSRQERWYTTLHVLSSLMLSLGLLLHNPHSWAHRPSSHHIVNHIGSLGDCKDMKQKTQPLGRTIECSKRKTLLALKFTYWKTEAQIRENDLAKIFLGISPFIYTSIPGRWEYVL